MSIYGRIIVAVDLTPDSLVIGRRTRALAGGLGAQLDLLHVVEPVPVVAPIPPDPIGPAAVTTMTALIDTAQRQIIELARKLDIPEDRSNVAVGDTRSEIIRIATDLKADLIVIGSHERHGLAFLIKPTEDVLVHRAPCDVLAVRLH